MGQVSLRALLRSNAAAARQLFAGAALRCRPSCGRQGHTTMLGRRPEATGHPVLFANTRNLPRAVAELSARQEGLPTPG